MTGWGPLSAPVNRVVGELVQFTGVAFRVVPGQTMTIGQAPCGHMCFDPYGNPGPCHPMGDLKSCTHPAHPMGDAYRCRHQAHPGGHSVEVCD